MVGWNTNLLSCDCRLTQQNPTHAGTDVKSVYRPFDLHPPGKHETGVGELVADGAVLEVRGMTFRFRRLRLHDLSRNSAIRMEAEVALPHPPGTAQASAVFGPWKRAATPVSGSFTLKGADLSKYEELEGILSGSGKFQGTLAALGVKGQADLAGFRARRKGPATAVGTEYAVIVNGTTGETRVEQADVTVPAAHTRQDGEAECSCPRPG